MAKVVVRENGEETVVTETGVNEIATLAFLMTLTKKAEEMKTLLDEDRLDIDKLDHAVRLVEGEGRFFEVSIKTGKLGE